MSDALDRAAQHLPLVYDSATGTYRPDRDRARAVFESIDVEDLAGALQDLLNEGDGGPLGALEISGAVKAHLLTGGA